MMRSPCLQRVHPAWRNVRRADDGCQRPRAVRRMGAVHEGWCLGFGVLSGNQAILVYLQPLSALSPFRASNMCDKPCRIAQVYDNGGAGVCRMVTEGKVGGIP